MSELHGESSNSLRERQGVASSQPADVPGRCEPGTGELNYTAIASALQEMGYAGVVGLEAYASEDDVVALERFRSAFTLLT